MKHEIVVFNGIKFYRYPDSRHYAHRHYFKPGIADSQRGIQSLHQEIWKASYGPIPPGCEIHHCDRDHTNNALENLVCLTEEEHRRFHALQPRTAAQKAQHMARIVKAAAWHRSPEGRAWHSKHAQLSYQSRESVECICSYCGAHYFSFTHRRTNKFCSSRCRDRERYPRRKRYEKLCLFCQKPYTSEREIAKYCSKSCAGYGQVSLRHIDE